MWISTSSRDARHERRDHAVELLEIAARVLAADERSEQREVEHGEPDRPFRAEAGTLVRDRQALPPREVVVVELRLGERDDVAPPPLEEPFLAVRLHEQAARLREQQQLAVERLDHLGRVRFEQRAQLGEDRQIFGLEADVAQALLDRLLGHAAVIVRMFARGVNGTARRCYTAPP